MVDHGYSKLKINKKFSELKAYLVPIDKKTFKDTTELDFLGEPFTSVCMLDFKKAGMLEYFGPAVTAIEVFFSQGYDDQGEPSDEYVGQFIVYFEQPKTIEAEIEFKKKLADFYEAPNLTNNADGTLMMHYWYNESTVLNVYFGYDKAGKKNGVYRAIYSANGG